uniref:ZSWIM1/3 RNaseH-like domain-containing protein n=1 Tax=Phytophthora ramorum TaxID=164328 RepID=H3HAQ7_PHYRM
MASTAHDAVPFQGRFPSWEAFDVARRAHCEKTYTMYVCRNSVKVAVANRRRKLQVPDTWVYDRKIYVCTHGYKRVSRSGGSRPRQNVRYTDCKARFTACVTSELSEDGREVLFIKATGQHLVHTDHPVTLEQWRMYSQNRAAVIDHPYLTHEAELMRRIGSNKRVAREHIETLTGKNAGRQLNSGASGQRVEPVLQRFVDADVENHVSILSGDDGSNEAICLASRAMKEHFQVFPELLILDVSMVTQPDVQPGQQLHGFLSMDALGNAKPVYVVRSLAMSSSLIRRACQDFKRTHPKITSGNSLAKCTAEILTMMKFIESEWTSRMLILELTKPVAMDHCDPLLHLMINCLSRFAVDLVSSQLTILSAHASGSVAVTKSRAARTHQCSNNTGANPTPASPGPPVSESTVRWLNKMTREKHILQRDGSGCDCDFFSLYQLPCRHLIWYEVTALQSKQLSVVAVGRRWFLRSFRVSKLASQRESNEIEYHLL